MILLNKFIHMLCHSDDNSEYTYSDLSIKFIVKDYISNRPSILSTSHTRIRKGNCEVLVSDDRSFIQKVFLRKTVSIQNDYVFDDFYSINPIIMVFDLEPGQRLEININPQTVERADSEIIVIYGAIRLDLKNKGSIYTYREMIKNLEKNCKYWRSKF